jgi:hypothetical protein
MTLHVSSDCRVFSVGRSFRVGLFVAEEGAGAARRTGNKSKGQ